MRRGNQYNRIITVQRLVIIALILIIVVLLGTKKESETELIVEQAIEIDKPVINLEEMLNEYRTRFKKSLGDAEERIAIFLAYSVVDFEGPGHDPLDPGDLTRFGISQRTYSQEDIKNLSRKQAAEIILRDYYYRYQIHEFNSIKLRHALLHMCVLIGPRALKLASEVMDIEKLKTLNDDDEQLVTVVKNLRKKYKNYLTSLNQARYRNGWLKRVDFAFYTVD